MTCISSCGDLSGRCAGLRFLAAPKGLDDAHLSAATGARLAKCERNSIGDWRVTILFGDLNAEQGANLCYIGLSPGTGEQAVVTDAVEPVRKHMDEETADELGCRKAHDGTFVT